jgi:hypothetical protein
MIFSEGIKVFLFGDEEPKFNKNEALVLFSYSLYLRKLQSPLVPKYLVLKYLARREGRSLKLSLFATDICEIR